MVVCDAVAEAGKSVGNVFCSPMDIGKFSAGKRFPAAGESSIGVLKGFVGSYGALEVRFWQANGR